MDETTQSSSEMAFKRMKEAFELLIGNPNSGEVSTREKSLAITNLEQAMMWLNKHRTMIGELKPNSTHVQ